MSDELRVDDVIAVPISSENFGLFGAVLTSVPDGSRPLPGESALNLSEGSPRFYLMGLEGKVPAFHGITRHRRVTQVLASVGGGDWMLAVAPPQDVDDPAATPMLEAVRGFIVSGDVAVLLFAGTWHAGPFFQTPRMFFFNLELADTNVVDHHTHSLASSDGVRIRLVAE